MFRALLVALPLLVIGCAARPAPDPEAPQQPSRESVPDVLGTEWAGESRDEPFVIKFGAEGILYYTTPTGSFDNGRWKQTGARIELSMNDHYSDYVGKIEGKTMRGTAHNKTGLKWDWSVRRQ